MAIKRVSPIHICWPALLYLVVGLTNVAADFVSFANEHVKTNERFLMISVKLVAIFLITIGLNLLCVNKLFYLSLIITGALSLYLIMDAVRIMSWMQPRPVNKPHAPIPTRPIVHLQSMQIIDPHDFLANKIVAPEHIIGFDTKSV
jgi:hypothetical protein